MSPADAVALLRGALEGITFAHEQSPPVAHRDLKPANVFVVVDPKRGAQTKVLDFGIAKAMQDGEKVTQLKSRTSSGFSAFSPSHGAPEQFRPKKYGETSPRTDVYALGLLLCEVTTGRPALEGDDLVELMESSTHAERPTPRRRGAKVSDAFEAVCERALALQPKERYATAGELHAALQEAVSGSEPAPLAKTEPLQPERESDPPAPGHTVLAEPLDSSEAPALDARSVGTIAAGPLQLSPSDDDDRPRRRRRAHSARAESARSVDPSDRTDRGPKIPEPPTKTSSETGGLKRYWPLWVGGIAVGGIVGWGVATSGSSDDPSAATASASAPAAQGPAPDAPAATSAPAAPNPTALPTGEPVPTASDHWGPPLLGPPSSGLLSPARALLLAPPSFDIQFDTSKGPFTASCTRDWAPKAADRLYNLVGLGYYDGSAFFRVVSDPKPFVAQFGLHGRPEVNAAWERQDVTPDPVAVTNARGPSCSRWGPQTFTTQLFVNLANNANLDALGFAPVCTISESGMKVVDGLYAGYGDKPSADQLRIRAEGNAFLRGSYWKLDFIERASIEPPSAPHPP
ncbi:MAG: peptidylprolyl isomerase [Polyangiaceae bacterium]|nr:peptidylprolyl isomerase [Polyangiaceae bacterium]